ncbi:MAG: hypothetical protein P8Y70_12900 [Candidatus Lokiarchaeota archaeon]
MPNYIAFDQIHKPRGKIDENYKELRKHLESNGFVCKNYTDAAITQESLQYYDIFVFVCPDFAKISRQEILEIENWVKDDGGGLLMLSHAGGDKGRNSNLSDLSELFGITFENDQVLDNKKNLDLENLPVVSQFNPPHPITSQIGKICYRAGCSLTVIGSAMPIVSSNDTSDPFLTPLVCVSEPEKGRVVCSGSYEMFRDKIGGGFQYETHPQFALNLFNWLVSEYRAELRNSEKLPKPEFEEDIEEICEPEELKAPSIPKIDFSKEVSSKEEILNLLGNFLDHIAMMSETNELSETAKTQDSKQKNKNKNNVNNESNQPSILADISEEVKKLEIANKEIKSLETEKEENEDSEVSGDLKERKEELEVEVHSLESKLKSILNLMGFVEKKYKNGDIDEKNYKEQTKNLHKDLDKIKRRIKKLSNTLQK